MDRDITMEDITEAIKHVRAAPWKTLEDDFIKIEISELGLETITLKPKARRMVDEFVKTGYNKGKFGGIRELFGIPIVVSEYVEEVHLI